MKTKFLLHGGQLEIQDPRNDAFFTEFTKDLADGDRVLFVGFTRHDPVDRTQTFERDKGFIMRSTEKKLL